MHCAHLDEAREMVGNALQETSPGIRFAAPPWNDQSAPWRQIDAQLPQDHLAREIREAMVDTMNTHVLPQAVEAELTTGERGALDGSAVAANASRRRLLNAERLQQRVYQLQAARHEDTQGETPAEVPAWMAKTPRSRAAQCERYLQAQAHLTGLQAANQHYSPSERRAPDKLVVSTGDPESALGVDNDHVFW